MRVARKDVIVIGASAGGFEAIQKVVAGFHADLSAAIFLTIHVAGNRPSILPSIISRAGSLHARHAVDGEPIQYGMIYVAPPDHHLLLRPGFISLSHGPRENMQRPSINAMFRSAATSYDEKVAGVLLTGRLDDGAAGLWEIQQNGGATVAQDPDEAAFPSMPESAIRGLNVQYIVRLAEMSSLLTRLSYSDMPATAPAFEVPYPGDAFMTCPECGGVMRMSNIGRPREFECHVGHRMGIRTVIEQKGLAFERAVESALAQSEEFGALLAEAIDSPDAGDAKKLSEALAVCKSGQKTLRNLLNHPSLVAPTVS